MNFEEWTQTEDAKTVMENIRHHVSYASRETVEQCLKAAYECGVLQGGLLVASRLVA